MGFACLGGPCDTDWRGLMANYFSASSTAARALGFGAPTQDTLVFSNATSSAAKMTVLYNAATATSAATITLIDNTTGRAVVFGTSLQGEGNATIPDPNGTATSGGAIVFPDGS